MPPHATVDPEICSGYGNCVVAAPDVFTLDRETGIAALLPGRPAAGDEGAVAEAEADCPVRAIRLSETSSPPGS
jgi:ferredoxin